MQKPLHGASDASVKDNQCSHAWILSTGEAKHINNPLMSFKGHGPVNGHTSDVSLAHGVLQGQTAL
jgi:hypothetical protein